MQTFLYKLVGVFSEYFKDVEEESVKDNFVIIYELLDEMMDFGYPQVTEGRILREYITQEGYKLEKSQIRPPMAVTNAVSWRSEGIKHRKNEVFLDVIESLNLLANANGVVLQSEIIGSVKMRVFLTGMPELRLGLNDKVQFENTGRGRSKTVELEDIKFHQCVRLSRFGIFLILLKKVVHDRLLTGEFQLGRFFYLCLYGWAIFQYVRKFRFCPQMSNFIRKFRPYLFLRQGRGELKKSYSFFLLYLPRFFKNFSMNIIVR
uniref:MHD domain-containing protein n=1 Tax=Meloidogyne incognita TaxID=6306 RepID=A0A914LCS8_MELIC